MLLALKLVLGMVLLKFARDRYRGMKKREVESLSSQPSQPPHSSQHQPSQPSQNPSQNQSKSENQSQNQPQPQPQKEKENFNTEGKRLGSWGMTELDDDKKRWIYDDERDTLRVMREKEAKWREKSERMGLQEFAKISRYEMVKRIW